MNIMTIDPGFKRTGIYATDRKSGYGYTIDTTGKDEAEALMTIHDTVRMLLKRHLPDVVIMEDYGYKGRSRNQMQVAEVKGIIKQVVYSFLGIRIIAMPIQTWKKHIPARTIQLKKDKKKYLEAVEKNHNHKAKSKDEADAYLIWIATALIYNNICKTESAKKIYEQLKEMKINE